MVANMNLAYQVEGYEVKNKALDELLERDYTVGQNVNPNNKGFYTTYEYMSNRIKVIWETRESTEIYNLKDMNDLKNSVGRWYFNRDPRIYFRLDKVKLVDVNKRIAPNSITYELEFNFEPRGIGGKLNIKNSHITDFSIQNPYKKEYWSHIKLFL